MLDNIDRCHEAPVPTPEPIEEITRESASP
jgi:hypothetical protein